MRVIHKSNSTKKNSKSNIDCNTYSNNNQPSESIQSSTINDSNARNSHSVLRHGLRFLGLYSFLKSFIRSIVYGGHPLPWRSSTYNPSIISNSNKSSSIMFSPSISNSHVNKYISNNLESTTKELQTVFKKDKVKNIRVEVVGKKKNKGISI